MRAAKFSFVIGYIFDNVCHSGFLPDHGVSDSVFLPDISLFSFSKLGGFFEESFFHAFVRDHVWHPHVIAGKIHWLKTYRFRPMGPYAPQGSTSLLPKLSVTSKVSARTSCAWVGSRVHFRSSEDVTLLQFTSLVDREYMRRCRKFH